MSNVQYQISNVEVQVISYWKLPACRRQGHWMLDIGYLLRFEILRLVT